MSTKKRLPTKQRKTRTGDTKFRVPTGLPKQNSDFSSQSHNISLTYIGTNFSTETAP